MSSLLEVVFENVLETKVIRLLMLLASASGRIVNVQCSEDVELTNKGELDVNSLSSLLKLEGDVSVLLNLSNMKIGGIFLPNVLLRLVKYSEHYDIDFNFDLEEIEDVDMTVLVAELHNHAKGVARDYDVADFFCGMEPASDEGTRYFTNECLGPLVNR